MDEIMDMLDGIPEYLKEALEAMGFEIIPKDDNRPNDDTKDPMLPAYDDSKKRPDKDNHKKDSRRD